MHFYALPISVVLMYTNILENCQFMYRIFFQGYLLVSPLSSCSAQRFFSSFFWDGKPRKGRKRLASQRCWKVRWGLGSWWESGLARFQDVAWLCTAGKEAGDHCRVHDVLASSGTDAGALGGQVRQQLNLPECPCSTGRAAHSPHGPLLRRRGGLKAVVSPPRGGT